MLKTDKKIISILLILIMIVSQILPVIAADYSYPSNTKITLEEYLIEAGVDEDKDGKLSDEEWGKVKNLNISSYTIDYTGIEKAVNLKSLSITEFYSEKIDLSKFKYLEHLNINSIDTLSKDSFKFPKIESLKELEINNVRYIHKDGKMNVEEIFKEIDLSELKNLEYLYIQVPPKDIDFSSLKNLKDLHINNNVNGIFDEKVELNLNSLKNLEMITITDNFPFEIDEETDSYITDAKKKNRITNIDISELSKLTYINFKNTYCTDIKYPNLSNIEYLEIDAKENINLDFTNSTNFYNAKISTIGDKAKLNKENIKINDNYIVTNDWYYADRAANNLSISKITNKIDTNKLFYINDILNLEYMNILENVNSIEVEGLGVLKKEENAYIFAQNIGKEKLTIVDKWDRKHVIEVNVFENEVDKTLGDKGITSKIVDGVGTILKSNGELLKINSETNFEVIDTNVKKYVTDDIYSNEFCILKNDGTLIISNGEKQKELSNVKDIVLPYFYLTEDEEIYSIERNYITEEVYSNKVASNVKKLIEHSNIYVLNDGTTWCMYREYKYNSLYTCKPIKLADFEAKEYGYLAIVEDDKDYYSYYYDYIKDLNDEVWYFPNGISPKKEIEIIKPEKDYKTVKASGFNTNSGMFLYIDKGNAVNYLDSENKPIILSNVTQIGKSWHLNANVDIITREDGSIWTYSREFGLTKIGKLDSTDPKPEPEEPNQKPIPEENYIKNENIKEKEIGEISAISGLKVKQTVEDFLKEDNFKEGYTVKVFDLENKEIANAEILGTGNKINLYKDGNLVKEYVIIIYGDTDGDGKIDSFDALTLIKLINEKIELKNPVYLEAGKVTGEEKATAVDALTIVKSLNGKAEIKQDI